MPPNVCPDASVDQIAALLARGIVRLFDQVAKGPISAEISSPPESLESSQDCLEVSDPTVLSVLTGLQTRDSERTQK